MISLPPGDRTSTRRVALYARVATGAQDEPAPIDQQLERLRAFAGEHGLTIVEEYADVGVSGSTPLRQRPAGGRLLADARRGAFFRARVESTDRLGRTTAVLRDARAQMEAAGLQVELTRGMPLDLAASLWQLP